MTSTVTSTMTTTTTAAAGSDLVGTVWQWQESAPDDPSKYTLEFLADGALLVQADCNRGRGTYRLVGKLLLLESIVTTLMGCPPGSLDTKFLEQVNSVDGYRREGANLVLTLRVAPGLANFAPAAATGDMQPGGVLTGTVIYLQRVALLPGSVISVQLQDVSKQDVAASVIASQTITTTGENVPIPFELAYDPAGIDARFTYALSVRITVDGQLRWINTERYAVLTNGAPSTNVQVRVQPAQ